MPQSKQVSPFTDFFMKPKPHESLRSLRIKFEAAQVAIQTDVRNQSEMAFDFNRLMHAKVSNVFNHSTLSLLVSLQPLALLTWPWFHWSRKRHGKHVQGQSECPRAFW